jgi:hypothetical protein
MAKQQQMAVTPLDSNVWKVTLTLAIPDYGSGGNYTALDAIIPTLDGEIQVLGMQQDLLHLVLCEASDGAVLARKETNTVPDDTLLDAQLDKLVAQQLHPTAKTVEATAPVKRKNKKWKAYKPTAKVAERMNTVHAALRALNEASADDIATVTGIPVKLVYNSLYALHDAKQIFASKAHGKVRWFAVKQ